MVRRCGDVLCDDLGHRAEKRGGEGQEGWFHGDVLLSVAGKSGRTSSMRTPAGAVYSITAANGLPSRACAAPN
jgi:hypothetical protein